MNDSRHLQVKKTSGFCRPHQVLDHRTGSCCDALQRILVRGKLNISTPQRFHRHPARVTRKKRGDGKVKMKNETQLSQEETDTLMQFAAQYMQTEAPRKISGRTRQHYQKTAALYFDRPEAALRTSSKATYYARKAALIFVSAKRMVAAIKASDPLNALKSARVFRHFFTYSNGPAALAAGSVCPITARAKVGKRKSLRELPGDWRAQMVSAAPSSYRDWILLLAVAGVRPEEIAMGVQVHPTDGDVQLALMPCSCIMRRTRSFRIIRV